MKSASLSLFLCLFVYLSLCLSLWWGLLMYYKYELLLWTVNHSTMSMTLFLKLLWLWVWQKINNNNMNFSSHNWQTKIHTCICNVSSAWRDQMSSSDSVAIATENASSLGYKHVCVNYLHVTSHDYQEVNQKHTSTHSLIHKIVWFFSCSAPTSLSTWIQVENESSKYY